MHFTIASDDLAAALKTSVASNKSTLPILSQVRVRASANNRVSFLTTDLEAYVETFCDADVKEAGAQCMQVSMLRPALEKDGDITINGDRLRRGRSQYRVPGDPAENFPATEQGERWTDVEVDPAALAYAVKTAAYMVDGGNPQTNYRAVMLVPGMVWGCHSSRGARVGLAYEGPSAAIPPHQVDRLCEALLPGARVSMGNCRENRAGMIRVTSPEHVLTLRLFDTVPIDFLKFTPLPAATATHARFKTVQLRNFVRRFLPFTEVQGAKLRFTSAELLSDRGEVELVDRSGDNRENLTDALVHVSGAFRSSLNPKLLLDAVANVRSDLVDLFIGDVSKRVNFSAVPVTDEGAPEELHVFAGTQL